MSEQLTYPSARSEKVAQERLRLKDVNADFHVFHFAPDRELGIGDMDAAYTIEELYTRFRYLPSDVTVTVGNHPGDYHRTTVFVEGKGENEVESDQGRQLLKALHDPNTRVEAQREYLLAQRKKIDRLNQEYGVEIPTVLFGIEADVTVNDQGHVSTEPPVEVLSDGEVGLNVVTLAIHDPRIAQARKQNHAMWQETITQSLEYAVGLTDANVGAVVNRLGHPFGELKAVLEYDPQRFAAIINSAKENMIAFEINAEKGFDADVLAALLENGNWLDFGSDFHAYLHWLKESIPEGTGISAEQQRKLELITRRNKFQRHEKSLWTGGAGTHPGVTTLLANVPPDIRERVQAEIWQLYKRKEPFQSIPQDTSDRDYVHARERIIADLLSGVEFPDAMAAELEQVWLRNELDLLFTLHDDEMDAITGRDLQEHERLVDAEEVGVSDLKGLFQHIFTMTKKHGVTMDRFVSAWDREKQRQFLRKEME